jgi:hypothetical protein
MMLGLSCRRAVRGVVVAIAVAGCAAGDNRVDPADLALRDLLGMSPDAALGWNTAQRAAARAILGEGLRAVAEPDPAATAAELDDRSGSLAGFAALDDRVARSLALRDARRAAAGADPIGLVRVAVDARDLALTARLAPTAAAAIRAGPAARATAAGDATGAAPATVELWLADAWDQERTWGILPGRGLALLSALAIDAGDANGPVIVVPAPRLAVIAAYIAPGDGAQPRLAVNPIVLAALEPEPSDPAAFALIDREPGPSAEAADHRARPPAVGPTPTASTGGNPYSFYGSVEECASAQRTRCAACLNGTACTPITDAADATTECTALDADAGRGYFLLCINLSLAITSVERCTGAAAPACPRDHHAADSLTTLDNNAEFLADAACADALATCLAKIYGAPDEPFPGLDGGTPPSDPPRSTVVSCGDACDSKNTSCDASPSFDCSGPSCNNSLSCDNECSSSNDQSGCGGNCNACNSGSGDGGGGGGCSSDSSSSGDSCGGGGCSSGSGSGGGGCSSGSGGGGCSSGSGSGGGGCSSGSGGGCSSGSGGGCGGGGGSSSKCSAAGTDPGPGLAFALSASWGLLPVPFAALIRRRARRRARANRDDDATRSEPASADPPDAPSTPARPGPA